MIQRNQNKKLIYLDNNATTQLDPAVFIAMSGAINEFWGNPSSVHWLGQRARAALIDAEERIAAFFKVKASQLLFTSGATEALNLALRALARDNPSGHIISSCVEHPAVTATLEDLARSGLKVTFLPTGEWGAVSSDAVREAIREDTSLITLMAANNETGALTDLAAIAAIAEERGIPLVIDGVAFLGKAAFPSLPGRVVWCFSGHKIHGPTGIGLIIMPRSLRLSPQITGGGQQRGMRGGTENLPAIIGFAAALDSLQQVLPGAVHTMRRLRDRLEDGVRALLPDVNINGAGERICNTSNLAFNGFDGESLLYLLDQAGLCASMGSACSSGALEPSRVLLSMGYPRSRAMASLRFSLSRMTTEEEIERAIALIVDSVRVWRS